MLHQRMLHVETQEEHAVLCLALRPDTYLFEGLDARLKGLPITVDPSKFHPGSSSTCSYALDLPGKLEEVEINTRLSPVALSCRTPNEIPKETRCSGDRKAPFSTYKRSLSANILLRLITLQSKPRRLML
jgi:hypothetical protein